MYLHNTGCQLRPCLFAMSNKIYTTESGSIQTHVNELIIL